MLHLSTILAQVDYAMRLKGMSSAFQSGQGEPDSTFAIFGFLPILFTLLLALLIARSIQRRRTAKRSSQQSAKLFTYALRQLDTRRSDRILLRMAARDSGLRQPVLMFFSPELLERYAGLWADSIAVKPLRQYARRRVDLIAETAFA